VPLHLRTNLTTRAQAALFHTSQSTVDRIPHHLVPVLAHALRPVPDNTLTRGSRAFDFAGRTLRGCQL
jgi:hypothetical protein